MSGTPGAFRSENSRWLRDGEPSEKRNRFFRAIFSRAWFVLLPLIGMVIANATQVRPKLKEFDLLTRQEEKQSLREVGDIRLQAGVVRAQVAAVSVSIDTLFDPRVEAFHTVIDSLRGVRAALDSTLAVTAARHDSLRGICDEVSAQAERTEQAAVHRSLALDSLSALGAALDDSLLAWDEQLANAKDELFRVRNPKEARLRQREKASGTTGVPAGGGE